MLKRMLVMLLAIVGASACAPTDQPTEKVNREFVAQWPNAVTYEIFVQSFADSNGDSIGDINGMTQQLDYIRDLGAKAIWLMPVSPSPSYHKYDITDYRGIHEDYGTISDFKKFVTEAHSRDIKVIIDLVVNHTDQNHPWFQESIKGQDYPYRDYYVWNYKDSIRKHYIEIGRMEEADTMIYQWHTREGNEEWYFGYFWQGMPDLNYDNPEVRKEIVEMGQYWLEELNVDGFRLDAALHIFPEEEVDKTIAWWEEFRSEMQKVREDVYLVGEVWAETETTAPFLNGLDAVFNFDLGFDIVKTLQNEIDSGLVENHMEIRKAYEAVNPSYVDATFLTNHDQNRIMSQLGNNSEKARLAAALLLTLPGSPYIYYGEELGMRGEKPDEFIREPFPWTAGQDSAETLWRNVEYNTEDVVDPFKVQMDNPNSMYNLYRSLISMRNQSPALTYGKMTPVDDGSQQLISFVRDDESESLLVIHNISGSDQNISLATDYQSYSDIVWQSNEGQVSSGEKTIPPYSSIVLRKTEK